jgi:hypothetical protein
MPLLVAAGVEAAFESAPLAAGVCSATGSEGVGAEGVDDETDFVRDEFDETGFSCGNLVSALGESLSVTSFDFAGFDDDFEDELAAALFASVFEGAILMDGDGVDAKGKGGRGTVAECRLSGGPVK